MPQPIRIGVKVEAGINTLTISVLLVFLDRQDNMIQVEKIGCVLRYFIITTQVYMMYKYTRQVYFFLILEIFWHFDQWVQVHFILDKGHV